MAMTPLVMSSPNPIMLNQMSRNLMLSESNVYRPKTSNPKAFKPEPYKSKAKKPYVIKPDASNSLYKPNTYNPYIVKSNTGTTIITVPDNTEPKVAKPNAVKPNAALTCCPQTQHGMGLMIPHST